MKKSKYGYIQFTDPRKLKDDGWDDGVEPEIRKPTPAEREKIVLNFIRDNSGEALAVGKLAGLLAVSDRTIQLILKKLETAGVIKRTSCRNKNNRQIGNRIYYTGPDTPRADDELTIEKLYDPDNPCGFRDWHWEEYKFIPGVFDERFTKEDAYWRHEDLLERKKKLAEKKRKS